MYLGLSAVAIAIVAALLHGCAIAMKAKISVAVVSESDAQIAGKHYTCELSPDRLSFWQVRRERRLPVRPSLSGLHNVSPGAAMVDANLSISYDDNRLELKS